jgi:hypothetical protein
METFPLLSLVLKLIRFNQLQVSGLRHPSNGDSDKKGGCGCRKRQITRGLFDPPSWEVGIFLKVTGVIF